MCTRCMVQAPVGIRCRDCGKAAPLPTFDVQRIFYARAIGVAVAIAVLGGLLWSGVTAFFGAIPFVSPLMGIGVGYAAGELISLSVNRKRSAGLALIAVCSVAGAFLISWRVMPFNFSIFGLLFIIVGVVIAFQRLR